MVAPCAQNDKAWFVALGERLLRMPGVVCEVRVELLRGCAKGKCRFFAYHPRTEENVRGPVRSE